MDKRMIRLKLRAEKASIRHARGRSTPQIHSPFWLLSP
jgi:hypothetical protein